MLLSVFPGALRQLREEHDRVFGPDFDETVHKLRENPTVVNKLEYTAAVITETLRTFPIGPSVRDVPPEV